MTAWLQLGPNVRSSALQDAYTHDTITRGVRSTQFMQIDLHVVRRSPMLSAKRQKTRWSHQCSYRRATNAVGHSTGERDDVTLCGYRKLHVLRLLIAVHPLGLLHGNAVREHSGLLRSRERDCYAEIIVHLTSHWKCALG